MSMEDKNKKRLRRKKSTRARVFGTKVRPRLSVYRSSKHIYAQIIDDTKGKTAVSASDLKMASKKHKTADSKIDLAYQVGELLAKRAIKAKIKRVVFDRGSNKYHGRVKKLAEGAREGCLVF